MGSDGRWYLAAASSDAAPVELSCFDDIIGVTLAAELRHACGVRAANLVVLLVKSGCSGTSNDQQTLPLLAKKPWWSMVVGSGGKSGLIGCRSAVREAREPRQIRAPVLILNSKVVAGKSAPWRACRPKSPQSNPISPNAYLSPCGAPGANRAAKWGVAGAAELEAKQRRSP